MLLVIDFNQENQIINILDENNSSPKKEEPKQEEQIDIRKEIQKQIIDIHGNIYAE